METNIEDWTNVAVGIKATAICCNNAIAIGDYMKATISKQHVIGKVLFGRPIPEEVRQFFFKDPHVFVWAAREAFRRTNEVPIPEGLQQAFADNPKIVLWLVGQCIKYAHEPYQNTAMENLRSVRAYDRVASKAGSVLSGTGRQNRDCLTSLSQGTQTHVTEIHTRNC